MRFQFLGYYSCFHSKAIIKSFVCSNCNSFLALDKSTDTASAGSSHNQTGGNSRVITSFPNVNCNTHDKTNSL